jgi:hypothetical protein
MTFSGEVEPLIQDPLDSPLFARLKRAGGDAVVLASNLDQGDLPLRIAFPVLMKNTIEWFQGDTGELRPALATGEMLAVDVSTVSKVATPKLSKASEPGSDKAIVQAMVESMVGPTMNRPLQLVSPSQQVTPLSRADEQVMIGPLLETGLWKIQTVPLNRPVKKETPPGSSASSVGEAPPDESTEVLIACNLVDSAESDLRPRGELEEVQGRSLAILGGQSLWFYLTLAAAFLIAVEWWLYQRRIVG